MYYLLKKFQEKILGKKWINEQNVNEEIHETNIKYYLSRKSLEQIAHV